MKKSGKKVCMDKSEFKGEHRRLIKLLRSGKGKKFKHEADEQEEEMKKYKEARGFREGRVADLAKRAGRALWNHKGDIAAMGLGAALGRKSHYAGHAEADRKGLFAFAGALGGDHANSEKLSSSGDRFRKFAGRSPHRNTAIGALGALATKKAIGFAGRTALRAGRWAKRKLVGESNLLELGAATAVGLMGAARRAGPTPRGKRALAIATRLNDKREKKATGLRSQALRMSSPLIAAGIELREGVGSAVKRVGSALWRHKGDIAAMALGAAATKKAGGFLQGKRGNQKRYPLSRVFGHVAGQMKGNPKFSFGMLKTAGRVAKYSNQKKGMVAGALGALAAKKAVGFAGRTALRAGRWAKRKVFGESQLLELSPALKARAADAAVKKGAEYIRKALGAKGTPDFQKHTNAAARKSRQFLRFRGKRVAESSPLVRALKTGAALAGAGAAGYGAYKLARSGAPQLMRANRISNRGERETIRKLSRLTDRASRVSKLTRGNYHYVNDFLRRRLGPKSPTIRTAAKYDRLSNAVGVPGFVKMVGAGGLLAAGAGLGAYALAHRNPNRR